MNGINTYKEAFQNHLQEQITANNGKNGNISKNLNNFLLDMSNTFGYDYSTFDPYINGNYAVFMQHGTWFETLMNYKRIGGMPDQVKNYISFMNTEKGIFSENIYSQTETYKNRLKFSQLITDISLPESNKEYMPISTRQKNSFVNTRDYVGSDFSLNILDTVDLDIIKYIEAWNKSIDLIREGLFFTYESNKKYFDSLATEDYLIENPYCNTIWVALFDSKGIELKGIIALFGVLPINTPLKTMIGDRGAPKITSYSLNMKFMDMQYTFIDGWDALKKQAGENDSLSKKFFNFLGYDDNKSANSLKK